MITNLITTILTSLLLGVNINILPVKPQDEKIVLSERQLSLENRYADKSVNEVMKKNILLNMAYLQGTVSKKSDINWSSVTSSFHFEKVLNPGSTFAFHEIVRKEYQSNLAFTTNAAFNASDGFLSDGYLFGDGVCHLASLINWAALDAGLTTIVPKDHRSVAQIPDIPDDYGVSIYMNKAAGTGANNNLYITNTKEKPVTFHFEYDGTSLTVYVTQPA
jgi:vancomycin resistance protein YoaR